MLTQRENQALIELLDRIKLNTAELLFVQMVLGRENQLATEALHAETNSN
jgi:hypothetical protein